MVEKAAEQAGAVEPRHAQPVDRPVVADERGAETVRDQAVPLEGEVGVVSHAPSERFARRRMGVDDPG
jgi:hypothetical protein